VYPDSLCYRELVESDFWNGLPNESIRFFGLQKRNMLAYSMALKKQYIGQDFVCPIFNNLYGPRDSYEIERTKVVGATIKKLVEAKELNKSFVTFLGTGKPTRQFTYVKDAAQRIVDVLENYNDSNEPINITNNEETSIKDLVDTVNSIVDYKGQIIWDTSQPDGQMRKSLYNEKEQKILGKFQYTSLKNGLKDTIQWYIANKDLLNI